VQARHQLVQRRKQLLRRERQQESSRLPTGHPRHSALHDDRNALYRRGFTDGTGVREQRGLLRRALCSQPCFPRHQWRSAIRVRRHLRQPRRQLHDDRRLLHRTSVYLLAWFDQWNMRSTAAPRRRYAAAPGRRGDARRLRLRRIRSDLHDERRLLQRRSLLRRALHLHRPMTKGIS